MAASSSLSLWEKGLGIGDRPFSINRAVRPGHLAWPTEPMARAALARTCSSMALEGSTEAGMWT